MSIFISKAGQTLCSPSGNGEYFSFLVELTGINLKMHVSCEMMTLMGVD